MVRVRLFLGVTLLGMTLAVSSAFAQASAPAPTPADEEARALFEAGRIAFGNRRYTQALEMFERAYELSPRPALLYNLGSTLDRLRRDREAVDAFRRYLEGEPNSERRAEVEERITILEQQLATSPEAVASANANANGSNPSTDATVERVPITKKWWFWTIIGVAVVGTAVGVGVGVSGGGTQGPATTGPGTMVIEL